MPLETQNIPIPIAQGVSTKADPKQVPMGKLLKLENGFFQTPGEIRKRFGFNALTASAINTGAISSGVLCQKYRDAMIIGDGSSLYSYAPSISKWNNIGPYVPLRITLDSVSSINQTSSSQNQSRQDSSYDPISGLRCFVWLYSGSAYVSIVDATTGNIILNNQVIDTVASSRNIRVVLFQNKFVLIYGQTTNIVYRTIATSTPATVSGATTIATNLGGTIDAVVISARLFITYKLNVTGISVMYLSSTFVASSELHNTSHVATGAAVWGDPSNNVYLSYSNASNVYIVVYDYNLNTTPVFAEQVLSTDDNVVSITGVYVSATKMIILWSTNTVSYQAALGVGVFNPTAGTVTSATSNYLYAHGLRSKAWVYNGNVFYVALYQTGNNIQPSTFVYTYQIGSSVIQGGRAVVIGRISYAETYNDIWFPPTSVTQISTGKFQYAFPRSIGTTEMPAAASTTSVELDFTITPQTAESANTLHLTGGQLWMYDGQNLVEHGFHVVPYIESATVTATGGIDAGTYQYVALYEWMDAQGQVHRSGLSNEFSATVTVGGASNIAVLVDLVPVTLKGTTSNPVILKLFRTAANGTVFYDSGLNTAITIASTSITINDTAPDSNIIGGPQLYTTGGQVENFGAPPCHALATYKSRLILIPSDEPLSWWFSQEVVPNSASSSATPVEFSEFFIQNVDQKGGPLTGVVQMDDKLVLFKKDLPYYVVGNGPASDGSSNDYSTPQEIVSPVGASAASSLVTTPLGVIFQASNSAGIWVLDRSLGVSYLGDDVEAYNVQSVTSAVTYPTYNQVRLTMSGGVVLAYDYYVKQWTVMTGITAVQACLFQGAWTWVKSNGVVYQESSSTFTDAGTFVQLKIGTSWLKLAGLQGFQRIYEAQILGEYESAHTLNADVFYDFIDTPTQSTAITPTSTAPYQWRLLFKRQKCESMKIELYDTEVAPAEAMRISAISMLIGIKKGLNKMPASRTFD